MREIKFRGKCVDNGEWVYGYLVANPCTVYIIHADWEISINLDSITVDPKTVGQYTGLKDKNGKDGFEHDVLDTPVGIAVIEFGDYSQPTHSEQIHVGFYLKFQEEEDLAVYRKDIGYWLPRSEIIGNIYDNPELIDNA